MPRKNQPTDPERRGGTETIQRPGLVEKRAEKTRLERPRLYQVVVHNDDYTTQEFVVYVLVQFFHHDTQTAQNIMLHVHTKGVGVAGVYTYDVAETKLHQTMECAREHEMPLQLSLRPDGEGDGKGDGGTGGTDGA